MGVFERFLTVWVGAAILVGVVLGLLVPSGFERVADFQIADVNLVVAVLIWLMVYPMMLKVEPSCLADVGRKPRGLILTLTINWLVKPFTMAALAVLFFRYVYGDLVSSADADE
jgi:ACR3 family arsenite transporter